MFSRWPPPQLGDRIGGSLVVCSLLGAGNMGLVYGAWDESLQRDVAVKFLRPDWASSPELRDNFIAEARAHTQVRHECIVSVFSFGYLRGVPYFVMERVLGETLAQRQSRALPLDEALPILDGVCRGLVSLHDAGLVHGDLTPSNVMVRPNSDVCIMDLGLSSLSEGQARLGAAPYVAPERLDGSARDLASRQRWEVYALGVLAFELLANRLPFVGPSPVQFHAQHLHLSPPTASELAGPALLPFDELLTKALAKDPAQRTASVAQLHHELVEAQGARVPRRFLIVDDDPVFAQVAVATLRATWPACQIRQCGLGAEALDIHEPVDLILLDLHLPDMSGEEVARRLGERAECAPILVVTAVGGANDWQRLAQLGAAGFAVKPIDPDALIGQIRGLLPNPVQVA